MKNIVALFMFILILFAVVMWYPTNNAYPPSNIFLLKRAREELIGLTKTNPSAKSDYLSFLLDTRMSELESLHEQKQFEREKFVKIIATASKYTATAGKLTGLINEHELTDKVQPAKDQFSRHKEKLNELSLMYPSGHEGWKFLSDAKNYLDAYESELGK